MLYSQGKIGIFIIYFYFWMLPLLRWIFFNVLITCQFIVLQLCSYLLIWCNHLYGLHLETRLIGSRAGIEPRTFQSLGAGSAIWVTMLRSPKIYFRTFFQVPAKELTAMKPQVIEKPNEMTERATTEKQKFKLFSPLNLFIKE